jgi:aspartate carbamoyltransferase regulatory subunit
MKKELKISAIRDGTVIDHIPSDATFKVADILNLKDEKNIISVATNLKSKKTGKKGIIKVAGKTLTKDEVNKIAVIAPKATLNIIENYSVREKIKVSIPDMFNKIIKCSNPNCITNNEDVKTKFYVSKKEPLRVKCHYCEREMEKKEIELV